MRGVRMGVRLGGGCAAAMLVVMGACAHSHTSSSGSSSGGGSSSAASAASGGGASASATHASNPALLEQVKGLKGEWESLNEQGQPEGTIRYEVTSAGHVVREVMFPGTAHEMTNMYHMDGDTLVMTHYCAMGNQPQMRAKSGTLPANGKPGEIAMKFDHVTNRASPKQAVMGNMTLVFVDANNVREEWKELDAKGDHGDVVIKLRRKKS